MTPRTDSTASEASTITTLIFDVDDTLYDVGTGFTAHRNGEGVQKFMVSHLNFENLSAAKLIRDEYFERYHATAKGLIVAEQEGKIPEGAHFDPKDLAEYWANNLDFSILKDSRDALDKSFRRDLQECPLNLVAFSNGPRKYVLRALKELNLLEIFGDDRVYAVDDVLPHCKPEAAAFQVVFDKLGVRGEECIMVEDSMKNIQKCKELGMKTVLITGKGRSQRSPPSMSSRNADAAEATKPGDAPNEHDPAVDVAIETVDELRSVLPGLWKTPAVFEPSS